ncbi:hypothetical protein GH714_010410 [Hevea brasiliensis]|uniref:MalT-like TPR region domain-containing protein n=1 Tax=Hevea brasiliensis TaxID=3981 RepID=A0A6A6M8E5_HEVBR|nr:hypothetical protein GH714_010410 [Hevea brasiliensis]
MAKIMHLLNLLDACSWDTYAMLSQMENSILCYTAGLEIERQVLGETDPRVGETCRYVAEAHVQALQFDEAEKLCQMALDIHREKGGPASLEEAADRRLMGLISEAKGEYETALEHYVLASMSMAANGQDIDVASIDCSIGDAYLSLARYDEAIFAYQKGLTVFKSRKGRIIRQLLQLSAILKFRACGEKRSVLFGIALNQMGLACVQCFAINEAADLFEEARSILEKEYGPYHPDTLGVYSNLAGTYDAMGRLDDAIEILDSVVGMREEKLGTANPDVDDEKRRLAELLKDAGRVRNRKSRSLVTLLHTQLQIIQMMPLSVSPSGWPSPSLPLSLSSSTAPSFAFSELR